MRKILNYYDQIDEELFGAREYAEKYIEMKSVGNATWSSRFKEMSNNKLKILEWLYEYTNVQIDQIRKVYTLPIEFQELMEKNSKKYIEECALIKQMLTA